MSDLISRQAVIDAFYQYPNINWTTLDVMEKINEVPSADSVKHGRWIKISEGVWNCSNCGNWWSFDDSMHIDGCYKCCPDCGARMDEAEEKEKKNIFELLQEKGQEIADVFLKKCF